MGREVETQLNENLFGEIKLDLPSPCTGQIWANDSVSPCDNLFGHYTSNVSVVWTPKATYRKTFNNEIEIFLHSDHTTMLCTREKFFSIGEKRFTIDAAPVTYAEQAEICRSILSIKAPQVQ